MRLTPSPLHSDADIDYLANALTDLWTACPISADKFVALAA
jgi:5-aminolevulinate synthase